MRGPLTEGDLEAIQPPDVVERWAAEPHPDDEVSVGDILVHASESARYAGDLERSVDLARRAVATGDPVVPDTRCYLLHGLLETGRDEEAAELAQELRRIRPVDPDVCELVGESYELTGHPDDAIRWFTRGLVRAERDDLPGFEQLAIGRARVRQAQGFAPDDYDELANETLERRRAP